MKLPKILLDRLRADAYRTMESRPPDEILRPDDASTTDYLHRWWRVSRSRWRGNIYIHKFLHSDDDRALHDHPWANASILLEGNYIEHTPRGEFMREEGFVYVRRASQAHRVELLKEVPWAKDAGKERSCVTMFITGPKVRDWGFLCPNGWRYWQDFVKPMGDGVTGIGRGCDD